MPPHTFRALARSANDAIVPAHLLEILQPDSRLFFIKLVVHSAGATTQHILEVSFPCTQHTSELNRLVWAEIIPFLDQVGSPRESLGEVIFRVTMCSREMLADQAYAGRKVLPLEVFLFFTYPAAELGPPTLVMVNVVETVPNCSVCLEELEVGSEAGRLPCNHIFHVDCIKQWATDHHRSCPNCRLELD